MRHRQFLSLQVFAFLILLVAPLNLPAAMQGDEAFAELDQPTQTLLQLAQVKANEGNFGDAEKLQRIALDNVINKYGRESAQTAFVLGILGQSLKQQDRLTEAKGVYQKAVTITENTYGPIHGRVALYLTDLAVVLSELADYDNAQLAYERALKIDESVYGLEGADVAIDLNNLGKLFYETGRYAQAKKSWERALAIDLKLFGPVSVKVAMRKSNLSVAMKELGDYHAARRLVEDALATELKIDPRPRPAIAYRRSVLAEVLFLQGDLPASTREFTEALKIDLDHFGRDHSNIGTDWNNLAVALEAGGDYENARQGYEEALRIRRGAFGGSHPQVATVLANIANVQAVAGDLDSSFAHYAHALAIVEQFNDVVQRPTVYQGLSMLNSAKGDLVAAVFWGKLAVNAIQALRVRNASLDKGLLRSFLHRKENTYRYLGGLLITQGRLAEAQEVMVMLKEEELFDFLRRDAEHDGRKQTATLGPLELDWWKRYYESRYKLAAIGSRLQELDEKARRGKLSQQEATERSRLQEVADAARRDFERFVVILQAESAKVNARATTRRQVQAAVDAKPLQDTLSKLGPGVVFINYVMGIDKLYIILTTPSIQLHRESAISYAALSGLLFDFKAQIVNSKGARLELVQSKSAELYKLLMQPIAEDLRQAKTRTLMVSLDGPLRYVPLSALYDSRTGKYLIETYALAIFTEAARDKIKDPPIEKWQVAGLGLSKKVEGFAALRAVDEELKSIVQQHPDEHGALPGRRFLDEKFTEQVLRDVVDQSRYPVVHIASHFQFRPGTETESFLVLGDGKHLSLDRMKGLRFTDKDLLTLSACETAVGGGINAQGAEIEGFAAIVQIQHAKAVIATLWKVADRSTAQLMGQFYRMRSSSVSKANALQEAQREFLKNDANAAYKHPYYWAPFVLLGNWR